MATAFVLLKTLMVFGLLGVTLFVLRRSNGLKARTGLLEVRGSTRLGKGATLTAVRVDGRDLLLGVTDHSVTLLTSEEFTAPEQLSDDEVPHNGEAKPSFLTALRAGRTPTEERPTFLTALKQGLPAFLRPESKQLSADEVSAALAQLLQDTRHTSTDGSVAAGRSDARREGLACVDQSVA